MKVAVFADIANKSSARLAVSSDPVKIVVTPRGEGHVDAVFAQGYTKMFEKK